MELSGRLTSFPVAELLHWAHNDCRTGTLVLRSAGREKRVSFRDGQIVNCLTDDPSEFYGQFLLLNGYLDRDTLFRCLSLCREQNRRLGSILRREGLMELADIQRTLRYHLEDVICDIFLWDHGVFFFRAEPPPEEELLSEPIATLGLALEGSHWVDEVGRIRQVLVDDYVVLGRVGEMPEGDMKPRLRRILSEVDGARRLEALYGAVHGSFYRFLTAAFELHEQGLVEVVHYGQALHARRKDAGLDDLLWQQATREQEVEGHHFAHLGDLENYVPCWVRPPEDEEWARMPDDVRELYSAFNGRRRLRQILSKDHEEWQRQIELLMLQIGKETIALLPAPISELKSRAVGIGGEEGSRFWTEVFGPGSKPGPRSAAEILAAGEAEP